MRGGPCRIGGRDCARESSRRCGCAGDGPGTAQAQPRGQPTRCYGKCGCRRAAGGAGKAVGRAQDGRGGWRAIGERRHLIDRDAEALRIRATGVSGGYHSGKCACCCAAAGDGSGAAQSQPAWERSRGDRKGRRRIARGCVAEVISGANGADCTWRGAGDGRSLVHGNRECLGDRIAVQICCRHRHIALPARAAREFHTGAVDGGSHGGRVGVASDAVTQHRYGCGGGDGNNLCRIHLTVVVVLQKRPACQGGIVHSIHIDPVDGAIYRGQCRHGIRHAHAIARHTSEHREAAVLIVQIAAVVNEVDEELVRGAVGTRSQFSHRYGASEIGDARFVVR